MPVTLKDIAAMAGVHKSTVDKVIHNRPGVSEEKRRMIRQLLDEMGYQGNAAARVMNAQKMNLRVAVVLMQVDAAEEILCGAETMKSDYAAAGIEVELYQTPYLDVEAQLECLRKLQGTKLSVLILLPVEDARIRQAVSELKEEGTYIITINTDFSMEDLSDCYVGGDSRRDGSMAARMMKLFLHDGGDILIVRNTDIYAVTARVDAFCLSLEQDKRYRIAREVDLHDAAGNLQDHIRKIKEECPGIKGLYIASGKADELCQILQEEGMSPVIICHEFYPGIRQRIGEGQISCSVDSMLAEQGSLAMRLAYRFLVYREEPETSENIPLSMIRIAENI